MNNQYIWLKSNTAQLYFVESQSPVELDLIITGLRVQCLTNWAKMIFACKSKTFRSLYNYALLILGESSKCKSWSAAWKSV